MPGQNRHSRGAQLNRLGGNRMASLSGRSAVLLLACAALISCADDTSNNGPSLFVYVRPGGAMCAVRDVEVKCGEITTYLRDVFRIKSDEYIAVSVDTSQEPIPFESMRKIVDALTRSGFSSVIGDVPLPAKEAS